MFKRCISNTCWRTDGNSPVRIGRDAAVAFFSIKARSKRGRYGFPLKPLWAELAMICVWSALIIGVLLLLAVLMNNTFRKMALSYSPKKK